MRPPDPKGDYMKMAVVGLFSLIASLFLLIAPASAQEDGWTLDGVLKVEDGRIFREQGFTLYRGTTLVGDLTACREGFCADLWTAQTADPSMDETDITVWQDWHLSPDVTFQANVAFFSIPDFEDVWRGRLQLSYQTSPHCVLSGNLDVMQGGLDTTVERVQYGCTMPVSEHLGITWQAGVAHDSAFRNTSVLYHAGLSAHVGQWNGELYGEGFEGTYESDGIVGLSLARRF